MSSRAPAATEWQIDVDGERTVALFEAAQRSPSLEPDTLFVCAHGAGGHRDDSAMLRLARMYVGRGLGMVRFNFLYRARGSGRPDPMPRLQACMRAVIERSRTETAATRIIIGGRSMGGRTASMLAAEGMPCDGLLLLAYPLHPAERPDKLRDAHLGAIRVPVLCLNGTRDALCRRELMEAALRSVVAPWDMHWLEGADHGFHVLKSSGRSDAQVMTEVGDATEAWLGHLHQAVAKPMSALR